MLRMLVKMTLIYHTCVLMRALVPAPPAGWARPYAAMAREDQLAWLSLDDVTTAAQAFLDPVLAGGLDAVWDPGAWTWR